MLYPPPGCAFHPRCPLARDVCAKSSRRCVRSAAPGQQTACFFAEELVAEEARQVSTNGEGAVDAALTLEVSDLVKNFPVAPGRGKAVVQAVSGVSFDAATRPKHLGWWGSRGRGSPRSGAACCG